MQKECIQTFEEEIIKENIIDYEIYLITDQFLSDFFPEGIYNDIAKKKK